MTTTLELPAPRAHGGTFSVFWQLTKPAVTRLVVVTMACGALVAPGPVPMLRLGIALFGTALVVAAANALNMYLERDSDAFMERTRGRPIPSGRLAPEAALWFGVVVALLGIGVVTFAVNALSGFCAAAALVSYVLVYTPLKRVTPLALYVGAVPGALPPVIGWTSVTNTLSMEALVLFGILFIWQVPHFLAISIFRQEDYERAGLAVFPAAAGLPSTKRHIVITSLILVLVSLAPITVGLGGAVYTAIAVLAGVAFVAFGVYGLQTHAGRRWARSLFFASMPYLVVVFAALVLSSIR